MLLPKGLGVGAIAAGNVSVTRVPHARWAYRISAGYFHSDALPRPSGSIPLIADPRDASSTVGGVAGTSGIVHTAIGPFELERGSSMGYASARYRKGTFTLNAFTNLVSASAPNLLLIDPATRRLLQLDFTTQTYDAEVGDFRRVGRHALTLRWQRATQ